jgi:outer membrane protein OmpA-like peptidoglycan-associated protein
MIRNNPRMIQLFAIPLVLAFATVGCATRGYARRQVAPVNQKVDTLSAVTDTKFVATNEKIELVAGIHQKDISQVNERISTAEIKLGLAGSAAQQAQSDAQRAQADAQRAQTTASSAMSESQENARKLAANSQASAGTTDLNYKLVASADVTFGFNKFSLTPEAKTELDQLASKVQSMPRVLVELVGFTDATGPQDYNLNLSRERADSVQRYLVTQKVPLYVIHTVGLGAEAPPSGLEEAEASSNSSKSEASRRVLIRIFGSADVVAQASAGGAGQN